MQKLALALLATAAWGGTAFAADMQVKAPRPAEAIYSDWSGIYVGVGAGGAWGRERLSNDLSTFDTATASSQLFGTSTARIFNGTAAIIQPPFSMSDCLISNCNTSKMTGFIAGGFAGAQKQLGGIVIGIEGSWDFLGLKKSFSASEDSIENVTRFLPQTNLLIPSVTVTGTALLPAQLLPVTATGVVPGQTALGATTGPAPVVVTVPVGGITATGTGTILPGTTGLGPVTISLPVIGDVTLGPVPVPISGSTTVTTVTDPGQTRVGVGATTGPAPVAVTVLPTPVTVTGTAALPAQALPVTATTAPQTLTLNLPQATTARALVTRSADLETKVDQIVDLRGKFGITNIFGPNVLLYATGGGAIGHFEKSLSITQTTTLCTTQTGACVLATGAGSSRSDTFSATSGDTRLGWVVGAGLDWKVTPNFVLGALYRHHDFPKGTVSFSDGTNSLGFGTSRSTVDSIQARISVLAPIQ